MSKSSKTPVEDDSGRLRGILEHIDVVKNVGGLDADMVPDICEAILLMAKELSSLRKELQEVKAQRGEAVVYHHCESRGNK